jgi:fructose-1,6-bisphosphatase
MVAAGYALYGSATMMVLSIGGAVNGFTLDPVCYHSKYILSLTNKQGFCLAILICSFLQGYWRICSH